MTKYSFKKYVKEHGIDDKSRKFFKKEYLDGMEIKDKDLDYLINLHLKMKRIDYLNIVKKMGSNFSKENFENFLEFRKKHKRDHSSKKYFQIVYGKDWKEKYNEFCEKISEANSLKGYIKKYGKKEGRKKWNEYIKKQRFNASKEFYIKKYGKEKGLKKWNKYCEKQSFNSSEVGFIKRYGEEEGKRRYKNKMDKWTRSNSSVSKESLRFFDKLNSLLEDNLIYGQGKELKLSDGKHNYFYDAYYQNKYIIEFHGDVFHGNPEKFGPDDHCHPFDKNITAKQLWEYDAEKKKVAEDNGYIYICFWEHEKPEDAYKKLLEMGIR